VISIEGISSTVIRIGKISTTVISIEGISSTVISTGWPAPL
jgi:hypothetical protein